LNSKSIVLGPRCGGNYPRCLGRGRAVGALGGGMSLLLKKKNSSRAKKKKKNVCSVTEKSDLETKEEVTDAVRKGVCDRGGKEIMVPGPPKRERRSIRHQIMGRRKSGKKSPIISQYSGKKKKKLPTREEWTHGRVRKQQQKEKTPDRCPTKKNRNKSKNKQPPRPGSKKSKKRNKPRRWGRPGN